MKIFAAFWVVCFFTTLISMAHTYDGYAGYTKEEILKEVTHELRVEGIYGELLKKVEKESSYQEKMWLMIGTLIEGKSSQYHHSILNDLIFATALFEQDREIALSRLRKLMNETFKEFDENLRPHFQEMRNRRKPFVSRFQGLVGEDLKREKQLAYFEAIGEAGLNGLGLIGEEKDLALIEKYRAAGFNDLNTIGGLAAERIKERVAEK